MKKVLALLPLVVLLAGSTVRSAEEDTLLPTVPYTSSGNARFFPVFHGLIIPAGGHVTQVLNVFNLQRVSIQAVATSTIGDAAFHVRVGFGPPFVADPDARLDLTFVDSDTARVGSLTPVKGPRLVLVMDNERSVPVTLNLGVYGTN